MLNSIFFSITNSYCPIENSNYEEIPKILNLDPLMIQKIEFLGNNEKSAGWGNWKITLVQSNYYSTVEKAISSVTEAIIFKQEVLNKEQFEQCSDPLKNDPEFVFAACENDPKFVFAACENDPEAIQHASYELRDDKEFMLPLVQKHHSLLRYASDDLQYASDDLQYASDDLKNDLEAIRHASYELRDDKEFMLPLVQKHHSLLRYASDALRDDKEFMLPLVQKHHSLLQYASYALRDDKEFILPLVQKYHSLLQYASYALRDDKEFILPLVQKYHSLLRYASYALRDNKEFMLPLVQKHHSLLQYVSYALQNDPEFVSAACKNNSEAI